ncbi:MAG: DUF58 domain-containing protein [Legionellales bacterium]|nr:DUF58 domain-containing protein [Legionellales bacterium]
MFKRKKYQQQPLENGVTVSLSQLLALRHHAKQINLHSAAKVKTFLAGYQTSQLRGRGIDFAEVRAYQPGDDIRHIDWRVTARSGKAHTKIFQEERERPIYLIVDASPSMFFGTKVCFKSVIAAKLAALYGWSAFNRNDRVGGFIFSGRQCQEFSARAGMNGILPLLKALTVSEPPIADAIATGALANVLKRLRRVIKPGSLVIICSDFRDLSGDAEQQLAQLCRYNHFIFNFIYDHLETEPPPADYYAITDGQEIATINTYSADLCKNYRAQFINRFEQLKKIARTYKIPLHIFATSDDIINRLKQYHQPTVKKRQVKYEFN